MASLPQMRRQNQNPGAGPDGTGGFPSVLPEMQILLRDSLSDFDRILLGGAEVQEEPAKDEK